MYAGMSFGAWLKEQRKVLDLTQEDLAMRVDCSWETIRKIESGVRRPSKQVAQLLASFLGIDADEHPSFIQFARSTTVVETSDLPRPPLADRTHIHNLPIQLTSFIGRTRELAEVQTLLAAHRLVTLTGMGGYGKTRLSLEVAAGMMEQYGGGVWFVELDALTDLVLVPNAVATVLGLVEQPNHSITQALVDHLQTHKTLLVLDNCEHVISACTRLVDILLRSCSLLSILATSRQMLDVQGESLYRVPALSSPDPQQQPPFESFDQYEAARLFIERTSLKRPDFSLTAENAPFVAELCYRLDGMPLSIELAAARMSVLSLEQIVTRLDERFQLLKESSPTRTQRQQTLRGVIDWSYDLLTEAEQLLLRGLSVFAGSCSIEGIEAICNRDADRFDTIDLLSQLLDKSLVVMETRKGEARYRLLETIRRYSGEKLADSGELEELRSRHLQFYLTLAETAMPELYGPNQKQWLERLETEHDNLRAALEWSQQSTTSDLGLRLVIGLWRFWYVRGYISEGRKWFEAALAKVGSQPVGLRANALYRAGTLAHNQGDYTWAASLFSESLAGFRELQDADGVANSLDSLGVLASNQGDYGKATGLFEESLSLRRATNDKRGIAASLNNLGHVATVQGNYNRAYTLLEQSLIIVRELGDPWSVGLTLNNLGHVALSRDDPMQARSLYEESLAIKQELGDKEGITSSLKSLGLVAYRNGEYGKAQALYRESLAISVQIGDKRHAATCLVGLVDIAIVSGHPDRSARLLGAAEGLLESIGARLDDTELADYRRSVQSVQSQLDETTFLKLRSAGRSVSWEQLSLEAAELDFAP